MAEPTPPPDKPAAKPAAAAKPAPAKAAPAKPAGAKPAPGAKAETPAAPAEIAAPTMKAEIRARLRKGRPARFDVRADGAVLGRDEAAAVSIPLDGVSREHARIKWDGKGWWLEDLKSTNGTFVNGEKVMREKLQHLDVIGLGRSADLVFLLRAIDAAAPAARKGVVRAALVEAEDGTVHEIAVGEFTLGRSSACNVVANENAVSKVHARIERSADQLLVEDLSSSNGTFVNGTRVRTAVLRDTDTLELANVAKFKVVIEQGELGATGLFRAPTIAKKADEPKFSGEWKTRYEWDPAELAAIAAAAAGQRPPELDKKGQPEPAAGPKHVVQAGSKAPAAAAPPAGALKPAAKPATPAAAKPATPAAAKPAPAAAAKAAPPAAAAKPAAPPAADSVGTPANEKVVPRPVKTESPAEDRPKGIPPPGRKSTPAGTDPFSTPSAPGLNPPPEAAPPSPIVPAVAPAAAAPKPPPAATPPRPAAPRAASARPVTPPAPVEYDVAGTVVDAPAPAVPSSPPPATPTRIAVARFAGEKFAFDLAKPGRFEVGRSASTAFRVDHTTVSRRHAVLTLSDDRAHLVVEDLGAANGTRVNGREIKGTQELQDGDTLEMGEVRFQVRFERS
ncbi:MAG TPA: FHA domain-containing protein [Vicinamibacteria bacterium]|nr:FHA domain-containing protein [Vicinamibacteria bacterium]